MQLFSEQYPDEATEQSPRGVNAKDEFTRESIFSKVKTIKYSFRNAIDSGKRIDGGNVAHSLY